MASDSPYKYLEGRLEVVEHGRLFDRRSALAKFRDVDVLVDPVPATPKERYVIRFQQNNRQPEKPPMGSFITSQIPEDFKGLALDDYVLVGLWEKKIYARANPLALHRIQQHYEPGNMAVVAYLEQGPKNTNNTNSSYWITSRGIRHMRESLDQTISRLPDPTHTPRVILAETEDILEEVRRAILARALVPIRMEALL